MVDVKITAHLVTLVLIWILTAILFLLFGWWLAILCYKVLGVRIFGYPWFHKNKQ